MITARNFVHAKGAEAACAFTVESALRKALKDRMVQIAGQYGFHAVPECRGYGAGRPDVLILSGDGLTVAFELQLSPLPGVEIAHRTKSALSSGIDLVVWVTDTARPDWENKAPYVLLADLPSVAGVRDGLPVSVAAGISNPCL
ncbi:hypothetical protein [Kitasatospora sp. NPDC059673]|uniref:hypothetical protein n=1 Tax=Kitasatospora sp. NPDC059673 TaxID=3346901 RepID=UPI00367EA580